jgi:hypothetical protein
MSTKEGLKLEDMSKITKLANAREMKNYIPPKGIRKQRKKIPMFLKDHCLTLFCFNITQNLK